MLISFLAIYVGRCNFSCYHVLWTSICTLVLIKLFNVFGACENFTIIDKPWLNINLFIGVMTWIDYLALISQNLHMTWTTPTIITILIWVGRPIRYKIFNINSFLTEIWLKIRIFGTNFWLTIIIFRAW